MNFRKLLKKSTASQEAEFGQMLEDQQVGWKDRLAMIAAALITIVIPCLLALLAISLPVMWLFGAL
ncbi:MAG: hypothetical protein IJ662_00565 [Clostridia bacterium]|nr:hypothetical protein [Clostridia bacterium]